ncbi:hypothetical protein [Acetobacter fallax]|uniref:Uncharacterized protein n=1 Tax=Acetobacter fallax TaxID=1737473 RepID=A0ABX0KAS8_9PROT|nr:hypothetical protein [Acetobacter fallax]NHO33080.1 hypothetical protein [Acetobacter fallax]NHO36674.1 hypothetical protein [Acetobacter fallax]
MTLALALLPLFAFLTVVIGPAVLPVQGLLTAISVVTLHHMNPDFNTRRMLFVACVALAISIVPTWKLGTYIEESRRSGASVALFLALFLSFAACVSLPAGELVHISFILPVNPSAITISLMVVFAGLAGLAVRPGIRDQFAGLLTACDGILLAAANTQQTRAVWIVGSCILLLAAAGLWLTQRLSLLREISAAEQDGGS